MSTLIALIRCAVDDGKTNLSSENLPNETVPNRTPFQKMLRKLFTGLGFKIISMPFWFGSLVSAVGGTTMQIAGVYRNCICYADAKTWWNIDKINPSINVASDTQDARNSSVYWMWMGSTATIFMAFNCYFGWWYQRLIRRRFTDAVKGSECLSFLFLFVIDVFLHTLPFSFSGMYKSRRVCFLQMPSFQMFSTFLARVILTLTCSSVYSCQRPFWGWSSF